MTTQMKANEQSFLEVLVIINFSTMYFNSFFFFNFDPLGARRLPETKVCLPPFNLLGWGILHF